MLKAQFARSVVSERFLREIGITARLTHPHVMPLLDSGATDDGEVLYYVMPLIPRQIDADQLDSASGSPTTRGSIATRKRGTGQ